MANFSDEYLRLLIAISEVAIVAFTDTKGRIIFANKKFCEISGYSFEELFNQDHRMLNSNHHDLEFFQYMYKTIHKGHVWRGEIKNRRKDHTYYWVDTQIIPIFNENNKIESFASVRFDITERKKMESVMINLEKMATLGEMSAVIAHEINNPLAVIQLSIESLKRELNLNNLTNEEVEKKINKIHISVGRISKLVRGLKTFSRTSEEEEYAEINLKIFLEEVLSFIKSKYTTAGIVFKTNEIPDISIECIPDQISQVLLNLFNNAYDAVVDLTDKWVELNLFIDEKNNEASFSIKDSGHGIPNHIAQKILNPFFTTKDVGKGTGLGLSISKAIIEEHAGTLALDKISPNTNFIFTIPLKTPRRTKKVS